MFVSLWKLVPPEAQVMPIVPFPGRFPPELYEHIVSLVDDNGTLFNLATTSKFLNVAALATLYHTLDFSVCRCSDFRPLQNSQPNLSPDEISAFRKHSDLFLRFPSKPNHRTVLVRSIVGVGNGAERLTACTLFIMKFVQKGIFPNLTSMPIPSRAWANWDLLAELPPILASVSLNSGMIFDAVHSRTFYDLKTLLARHKKLHSIRITPNAYLPTSTALARSKHPVLSTRINLEAIEGSFLVLRYVLPRATPSKFRLHCHMDSCVVEEESVASGFYSRFSSTRVLSFVLPLHKGGWQKREFFDFIPHLHNLEVLELKIPPMDDTFLDFLVSAFHGLPRLFHIVITMIKGQKDSEGHFPVDPEQIKNTFVVLDSFSFVPNLKMLDIQFHGTPWHYRSTRWNRSPVGGIVHRNDWWMHA